MKDPEVDISSLLNTETDVASGQHTPAGKALWSLPEVSTESESDLKKEALGLTSIPSSTNGGEVLELSGVPEPPGQRRDLGDDEELNFFGAPGTDELNNLPPQNIKATTNKASNIKNLGRNKMKDELEKLFKNLMDQKLKKDANDVKKMANSEWPIDLMTPELKAKIEKNQQSLAPKTPPASVSQSPKPFFPPTSSISTMPSEPNFDRDWADVVNPQSSEVTSPQMAVNKPPDFRVTPQKPFDIREPVARPAIPAKTVPADDWASYVAKTQPLGQQVMDAWIGYSSDPSFMAWVAWWKQASAQEGHPLQPEEVISKLKPVEKAVPISETQPNYPTETNKPIAEGQTPEEQDAQVNGVESPEDFIAMMGGNRKGPGNIVSYLSAQQNLNGRAIALIEWSGETDPELKYDSLAQREDGKFYEDRLTGQEMRLLRRLYNTKSKGKDKRPSRKELRRELRKERRNRRRAQEIISLHKIAQS